MRAKNLGTVRSDGQVYNRTKVRTHEDTDTGTKVRTHAQWIGNPLNPPGVGWVNFFRWELIWPISSHPIKMWARSDGRFEKSVLQVYNRIIVYSVCIYIAKSFGYYDFGVLSMSVMGFPKKKFGWGVGGWGEFYPNLFWIFWNFFNYAKPLRPLMLSLWKAERHFCHLWFTVAATILSFGHLACLLAWILSAQLSVNVQ